MVIRSRCRTRKFPFFSSAEPETSPGFTHSWQMGGHLNVSFFTLKNKERSIISWVFSTCPVLSSIIHVQYLHQSSQRSGGWYSNNCVRDKEIEVWRGEAICPWSNWQRASRVRLWKPCFHDAEPFMWTSCFLIWSGRTSSYMSRTTTWRLTNDIFHECVCL